MFKSIKKGIKKLNLRHSNKVSKVKENDVKPDIVKEIKIEPIKVKSEVKTEPIKKGVYRDGVSIIKIGNIGVNTDFNGYKGIRIKA